MGYVYRYTDIADGIVKYVGIVSSENRTLLQRVKEHQTYDDWCNGSQWKIEYLEINNKTDCEGLESHFISLYETDKWYNTRKTGWGVSNIYSMFNWKWEEFEYSFKKRVARRERNKRIGERFLSDLYEKSIYIFNNGNSYCFFKTFKKKPTYIFMALSEKDKEYAIKNNLRFMNGEQLDTIISLMEEDGKPYGYSEMLEEVEQIKLEDGLNVEDCFTYKEQKRIFKECKKKIKEKNIEIDEQWLKEWIKDKVYQMRFDY